MARPLIILSCPEMMVRFLQNAFDKIANGDPHLFDDVKRVVFERAQAKLRTIQTQQSVEPNKDKLNRALAVLDVLYDEC